MRPADGALLIIALAVAWSLYRAQMNKDYSFDLFDVIMEGGKVSRLACVFMGAFSVSSWIMVRLTFDGKMTEGMFTAYGAVWCAPIIAKLFSPGAPAATTSTTSTTNTNTPIAQEKQNF